MAKQALLVKMVRQEAMELQAKREQMAKSAVLAASPAKTELKERTVQPVRMALTELTV